jgi:phosphatidylglycerophosphatase A
MELTRWEKIAGSFFYVGFTCRGPGTVTSALVFMAAWFASSELILVSLLVLLPVSFYLAYRFEKCIGHDPSSFTMDEVIGSLIVLCCIPHQVLYYLVFFIVWRLLDIFKPLFKPVEQIQQGIGIMLDDIIGGAIAAGAYFLFVSLL